ncbi:IS1182 family transposase [Porphyromonas cangingivalis]|uniref:IS1182 family transposase n=1 Tax=Porphyromonas cangingivalis TaxID=36874 RepID=UPI00068E313C|nr:IS1182 family transposase [Porphyromonas cangingivalis]
MSTKLHFRPYISDPILLFPPELGQDIDANDPVRLVNSVVDTLKLESIRGLYHVRGRSAYHPRMMLKVLLYAYMNNVYSCRKIKQALRRDIHYIWLSGYEKPDFATINRFRNRMKTEVNKLFTQLVLLLSDRGFLSLDVSYIDGTKLESKANKYTFVWRKSVERNKAKLEEKIKVLLEQVDDVIAQDQESLEEVVELSPELLGEIAQELNASLEVKQAEAKSKEEKAEVRRRKRQLKELNEHRAKLAHYNARLKRIGTRNSMSKTDPDATFMRMKEDAMNNGQTKPGYNLQIASNGQFITAFDFFPNPTDTLTLPAFLSSIQEHYGHYPQTVVADAGYGSEENYHLMQQLDCQAYVKYNRFHLEQRPRYKTNPFHPDHLFYNVESDFYVCPMGQRMRRIGTRKQTNDRGFTSLLARYRAENCTDCPLRGLCFKAKGNRIIQVNHRLNAYKAQARDRLTSEQGLEHRKRRCIEPEAVFGQFKANMGYRRFRHMGLEQVKMDFAFLANAFNLKKLWAKLARKAKNTTKRHISTLNLGLMPFFLLERHKNIPQRLKLVA